MVPPSASFQDVDNAELYAIENNLGNVISGSYGSEELYTPTTVVGVENSINEIAALMGISADFATGDDGDYTFDEGFTPSVIAPAAVSTAWSGREIYLARHQLMIAAASSPSSATSAWYQSGEAPPETRYS